MAHKAIVLIGKPPTFSNTILATDITVGRVFSGIIDSNTTPSIFLSCASGIVSLDSFYFYPDTDKLLISAYIPLNAEVIFSKTSEK